MDRIPRARCRLGPAALVVLLALCAAPAPGRADGGPEPAGGEAAARASSGEPSAADDATDAPAPDWELLERHDTPGESYTLWGRVPPGSKWRAFRLVAEVDVPPAVAVEAAMDVAADPANAAPGETRHVLRRTPDVIVTYIRADLPLAADRDVTTHLEREKSAEPGVVRLVWREANDEGPPPEEGVVRMPRARGSWTFEPLAGGRTRVVFESHAELGGSLPAWIINPFVAGTIVSNIEHLRAEIARRGG